MFALVTSLGPACSASDSSSEEAQIYAMRACNIEIDAKNNPVRDADGRVAAPSIPDESLDIDLGPYAEFEESVNAWSTDSEAANAASQLDQRWQPLATAMTERLALRSRWLLIRKDGGRPSEIIETISIDVAKSNARLEEWRTICGGLARRLSR